MTELYSAVINNTQCALNENYDGDIFAMFGDEVIDETTKINAVHRAEMMLDYTLETLIEYYLTGKELEAIVKCLTTS